MIKSNGDMVARFEEKVLGTIVEGSVPFVGVDLAKGVSWSTMSTWNGTAEFSVDDLKRTTEKCREMIGRTKDSFVEGIVMTQEVYNRLRRSIDCHTPYGNGELDRYYGIQIFCYATAKEACSAYREMRKKGKNVIYAELRDLNEPDEVKELPWLNRRDLEQALSDTWANVSKVKMW